jgi:hypothetical protein
MVVGLIKSVNTAGVRADAVLKITTLFDRFHQVYFLEQAARNLDLIT